MKQYKVTNPNGLIFYYGGEEKTPKDGDVVELDENNITTRALVERKQIVEVVEETPQEVVEEAPQEVVEEAPNTEVVEEKAETPPADKSKPKASSKTAKK